MLLEDWQVLVVGYGENLDVFMVCNDKFLLHRGVTKTSCNV
jgi:hypothetical protein